MRVIMHHWWRRHWWVAVALAMALHIAEARAAQSEPPTTYHDCYRSLRTCQKRRCNNAVDLDQVSCVRECAREYDTCVSGARSGGLAPGSGAQQRVPRERTPRDLKRYKTPRGE